MGGDTAESSFLGDVDSAKDVESAGNQRPPHIPSVDPANIHRDHFKHVQFVGFISDFKQNRRGDIQVTITVPFRYRQLAMPCCDAHMMPVNVDVVPWKRATEDEG